MKTFTIIRIKDLDGCEVAGYVTEMAVDEAAVLVRGVIKAIEKADHKDPQSIFNKVMLDLGFVIAAETEVESGVH